jgi:hypothetical protein
VDDKQPADQPQRMMNVTWTGTAQVNSKLKENQVLVTGQVKAVIPEADGTVNTASADLIYITLTDKPADTAVTQPTSKPAMTPRKPVAEGGGAIAATDVDVIKGKEVSRILLSKDAVIDSKLTAPDGSILRETRIDSQLLQYDLLARRLTIPRPGRMLVRDHTPPDEKDKPKADADGLSTQRGATAFQWAKNLDYSGVDQRAIMRGDVLIAYKPDEADALPVQVRADEVVARFEDKPAKDGTAPAHAPAPAPANPAMGIVGPSVQLRSVRVEGNVHVVRGTEELTAPRLTYDPISHWMRASGTDQTPAVFTSGPRGSGVTAREVVWNTKTWKIRAEGVSGRAAEVR